MPSSGPHPDSNQLLQHEEPLKVSHETRQPDAETDTPVEDVSRTLGDDGATAEKLAAMGYLTLGRRFLNNKHDIIDDRIDVVTRGMMGLTVTCARCHDKIDPLGMVMENFDPVGAWRTHYPAGRKQGPEIDASAVLASRVSTTSCYPRRKARTMLCP